MDTSRQFPFDSSTPRSNNSPELCGTPFLSAPIDPSGTLYDLSDRLLICSSTDNRTEVIVGGSDHALYSIDVSRPGTRPTQMYGKRNGHTDWVTSVAHLRNGKVLSGAMDGKLCLWHAQNRSSCVELQRSSNSTQPISKVLSDRIYNIGVACSYDGMIDIFNLESLSSDSTPSRGLKAGSGRGGGIVGGSKGGTTSRMANAGVISSAGTNIHGTQSSIGPLSTLVGHAAPITDCSYIGNKLASGDKGGHMVLWDLVNGSPISRFRCHPGPITAIEVLGDGGDEDGYGCSVLVVTAGVDGYVKLWDPRSSGSGMVQKIPAHVRRVSTTTTTTRAVGNTKHTSSSLLPARHKQAVTSTTNDRGPGPGSSAYSSGTAATVNSSHQNTGNTVTASAIGCMVAMRNDVGSSSGCPYLITGAGGGAGGGDSSIALIDIRRGSTDSGSDQIVTRWEHQQNGVYSMCLVGNECLLSGDGMGNLVAHEVLSSSGEPLVINAAASSCAGSSFPSSAKGRHIHKQAWCDNFATDTSITNTSSGQIHYALGGSGATSKSQSGSGCKYGIVASERGAVRSINALNNKVVACGEDGNVLVFDYKDIGR